MKRIVLVLVLLFAFAIPAWALGTVTTSVETHDFTTFTFTDTTEIYFESKLGDDMTAGITLTVNDLIFDAPITAAVDATLDFVIDEATAQLGVGYDITSGDSYVKGKLLDFSITDDMALNAKVKYNYPAGTYWGVANVVYSADKFKLIAEVRTDSDGAEVYSIEAQLVYEITEDISLTVGQEFNDWSDSINDWDAMEIVSGADTTYAKIVIRF